jgi:hypothetical protein
MSHTCMTHSCLELWKFYALVSEYLAHEHYFYSALLTNCLSRSIFFPHFLKSNIIFANGSFKEASYSGGGNVTFKGTLEVDAFSTRRLFHGELPLGDLPIHFTYSVSYLFCVLKLLRSSA